MTHEISNWRSADGDKNAYALRTQYAPAFRAIAEVDRMGHLLLSRAGSSGPLVGVEGIVGVAQVRRAVTLFAGVRALLEQSLPDPAKALARSYFELWINYRCLAYGSVHPISLETATVSKDREVRARRYYVAGERRAIRSRALILSPDSQFRPSSQEAADALEREILDEIQRLRTDFPEEWTYFGEVTAASVVARVGGRDEPAWYTAEFPSADRVKTIGRLASAFGYKWDYDFLYEAWSAVSHPRGIRQDVTVSGDQLEVHHPHDPSWFRTLAFFVFSWHQMLLMTAAKWHAPVMIPQLQAVAKEHANAFPPIGTDDVPELLG